MDASRDKSPHSELTKPTEEPRKLRHAIHTTSLRLDEAAACTETAGKPSATASGSGIKADTVLPEAPAPAQRRTIRPMPDPNMTRGTIKYLQSFIDAGALHNVTDSDLRDLSPNGLVTTDGGVTLLPAKQIFRYLRAKDLVHATAQKSFMSPQSPHPDSQEQTPPGTPPPVLQNYPSLVSLTPSQAPLRQDTHATGQGQVNIQILKELRDRESASNGLDATGTADETLAANEEVTLLAAQAERRCKYLANKHKRMSAPLEIEHQVATHLRQLSDVGVDKAGRAGNSLSPSFPWSAVDDKKVSLFAIDENGDLNLPSITFTKEEILDAIEQGGYAGQNVLAFMNARTLLDLEAERSARPNKKMREEETDSVSAWANNPNQRASILKRSVPDMRDSPSSAKQASMLASAEYHKAVSEYSGKTSRRQAYVEDEASPTAESVDKSSKQQSDQIATPSGGESSRYKARSNGSDREQDASTLSKKTVVTVQPIADNSHGKENKPVKIHTRVTSAGNPTSAGSPLNAADTGVPDTHSEADTFTDGIGGKNDHSPHVSVEQNSKTRSSVASPLEPTKRDPSTHPPKPVHLEDTKPILTASPSKPPTTSQEPQTSPSPSLQARRGHAPKPITVQPSGLNRELDMMDFGFPRINLNNRSADPVTPRRRSNRTQDHPNELTGTSAVEDPPHDMIPDAKPRENVTFDASREPRNLDKTTTWQLPPLGPQAELGSSKSGQIEDPFRNASEGKASDKGKGKEVDKEPSANESSNSGSDVFTLQGLYRTLQRIWPHGLPHDVLNHLNTYHVQNRDPPQQVPKPRDHGSDHSHNPGPSAMPTTSHHAPPMPHSDNQDTPSTSKAHKYLMHMANHLAEQAIYRERAQRQALHAEIQAEEWRAQAMHSAQLVARLQQELRELHDDHNGLQATVEGLRGIIDMCMLAEGIDVHETVLPEGDWEADPNAQHGHMGNGDDNINGNGNGNAAQPGPSQPHHAAPPRGPVPHLSPGPFSRLFTGGTVPRANDAPLPADALRMPRHIRVPGPGQLAQENATLRNEIEALRAAEANWRERCVLWEEQYERVVGPEGRLWFGGEEEDE